MSLISMIQARRSRKPRWFEVRLHVLLITITVFAVPLSLVVGRYYRSWRQERAISLLKSRGARIGMLVGPLTPAVARSCWLRGGHVWTDDDMALVAQLNTLTELTVNAENRITDEGVKHLLPLRRLSYLGLRGTMITDRSAGYLAKLKELDTLHLGDTSITDATLEELLDLPKLDWLTLNGTRVTAQGVRRFKAAHDNASLSVTYESGSAIESDAGMDQ